MTAADILDEIDELRCAIRQKERQGDSGDGITEGLRSQLRSLQEQLRNTKVK